ncbi:MAG TPA: hypothetical protein VIL86_08865 [Tepidisphaeraceae bacterium]|jgi:hypothetical protein
MNRIFSMLCVCGLGSAVALGQPAATQPAAMPAGHPDISQYQKPAPKTDAPLPSGHPDISTLAGDEKAPALPSGHPDIATLLPTKNAVATTKPTAAGTLEVQVLQGTKGGPAIGADPVVVELLFKGEVVDRIDTQLNSEGSVTIPNLPVMLGIQPSVKITHGGYEYTAVGEVMDKSRPGEHLEVKVYETTEEKPAWSLKMRHIIIQNYPDGLRINEMLAVNNPSDRTWLGTRDAKGERATFVIELPKGAEEVQPMMGFTEGSVKVEGGKLVHKAALAPGTNQYQITYCVPSNTGKVDLAITAPATVEHMMVFVPDDGTSVTTAGLESLGSAAMEQGATRYYKGTGIESGKQVAVVVDGLLKLGATAAQAGEAAAVSSSAPKIIAGVGAALILIVGATIIMLRSPKGKPAKAH